MWECLHVTKQLASAEADFVGPEPLIGVPRMYLHNVIEALE